MSWHLFYFTHCRRAFWNLILNIKNRVKWQRCWESFCFCCFVWFVFCFCIFNLLRGSQQISLAGLRLLCSWCLLAMSVDPPASTSRALGLQACVVTPSGTHSLWLLFLSMYNCSFVFFVFLLRTLCCSLPPTQDVAVVAKRFPPFLKGTGGWESTGRLFYLAGDAGRPCWSFMW